eukprot:UN00602
MKFYNYNLSDSLLTMEMCPGGGLFDILYYVQSLKENVARSYFKQLISGLKGNSLQKDYPRWFKTTEFTI